jgi:murein L,D-transpeptidase YcbB/YkuD
MINHTITPCFIHKKLQHPLTLLLILSILVWLLATCSTEEQPAVQTVKEEAVRETINQEQTVQIEPKKPDQTEEIQKNIRAAIEQMIQAGKLKIGDVWIAAISILSEFYERRQFKPAWTATDKIDDLMSAINDIEMDGLIPDDYHFRQLREMSQKIELQSPPKPQLLAYRDLLLTDALVLMGYHLNYGKVDPGNLDPNWNMSAQMNHRDPATLIQEAIDSGSFYEFLSDLKPRDEFYNQLKVILAQYQNIKNEGGWQPIPAGPALKKGVKDDRVTLLRNRLLATGDLAGTASMLSAIFDDDLKKAVMHFQLRYGLESDGIVGKNTLAAMNVPVEMRIDQIRVNLERIRWVLHEDLDTFVFVNIPGFKVYYVQNEMLEWTSRAQVGKLFRQTPVFKADMTYLEFNPTWTIPPTILAKDILPAVRKDPGYLQKRDIRVIDSDGKVVNPKSINWSKYTGKNFPYQLRQDPGPNNALGQVKFMFPNKHMVYLHDTPNKNLFDRESRAFSSGCVRIENPFEFAQLLLGKEWNANRIDKVIESKKTTAVKLADPVPVILFYLTALPEFDGKFHFRNDVYSRDEAVLEDLNAAFKPADRLVRQSDE